MNRLFLFLLILSRGGSYAGDADPIFYTSGNRHEVFIVAIRGANATVTHARYWEHKFTVGYRLIGEDTLLQSATDKRQYYGRRYRFQLDARKPYLELQTEGRRRLLKKTSDNKEMWSVLNNAYWWTSYFRMCDEVGRETPPYYSPWFHGISDLDNFEKKMIPPGIFRELAERRIKQIKDSVTRSHLELARVSENTMDSAVLLSYPALKDRVAKVYAEGSTHFFFDAVVREIALAQAELFFRLAEDMPQMKDELFSAASSKEVVRVLRRTETESAVKAAFLRHRRANKFGLIGGLLGQASIIAGIVMLVD